MCESLAAWLREDGYLVDTAASGREAVEKARLKDYAIYFVDLKMPGGMDGIETMMQIRKLHADASIIIITAYATVDTAITAMKEGAQEYIVKPCNPELVSRIIKVKNLQRENTILRKKLARQYSVHDVISKNSRMQQVLELAKEVANLPSTVLIQGESGTGKELIARAIHNSGERASKPFVAVSCAALAETLLESELFGHEKGSFTGATGQKRGKFELAGAGTIFLEDRRHLAEAPGGLAARAPGPGVSTAWAATRKCASKRGWWRPLMSTWRRPSARGASATTFTTA
jgi:DNA-binding NtrC family response regulator